jgi:hypothetical protein
LGAGGKAAALALKWRRERRFSHIYQRLERAEAALTCRQGDFAEDPSEDGKTTKTSEGS